MSTSPAGIGSRPVVLSDRQGFDRRWFASKLEAVYVPKNDAEAVTQITDAISRYGRDVKVVSGRHCYENFIYNDTTRAIIDMSSMNRAGWDERRPAFFVEAGCENWSGYRTLLNGFNKTLPGGSCYSVGAGGHITGACRGTSVPSSVAPRSAPVNAASVCCSIRSSGPTSVASTVAASRGLPTMALASRCATGSIGPETGTPRS